ncbi:hypothetical protein EVAR_35740_1 [Eumeta japonica]|uniref:Uncharacterized protein n=1 Tax=Eumeta variegata TaxID=151549 RepID=A0A4C1VEQ0_EUMVA|nr:hypothetical protein EVAR_35740_1 [Eumeta japonica]
MLVGVAIGRRPPPRAFSVTAARAGFRDTFKCLPDAHRASRRRRYEGNHIASSHHVGRLPPWARRVSPAGGAIHQGRDEPFSKTRPVMS